MTPDATATATAARQVQVDHGVRIAELVATLSYAADLGLGQPMAHCMRQTVIALRLADLVGATERERATTFYLGLMMNVYCHADAAEQATWFGDDIGFKAEGVETLGMNTAQIIAFFMRRVGSHGSVAERAKRLASFPLTGQQLVLGLHDDARGTWARSSPNGSVWTRRCRRGRPGVRAVGRQGRARTSCAVSGSGCPRAWCSWPARSRSSAAGTGLPAALAMARRHRGTQFDPASGRRVLRPRGRGAGWPRPGRELGRRPRRSSRSRRAVSAGPTSTSVLEAMADLVDLKSPLPRGPLARGRQPGRRGGAACLACRPRSAPRAPRGAHPRPRPARSLQRDLGQAGPPHRDRAGARPAAPVPDRPHAGSRGARSAKAARSPHGTTSVWTAQATRAG